VSEKDCEKLMKSLGRLLSGNFTSLQHLIFGSNLFQSTKFAFSLYFWTKLSKCFSGLTVLILLDVLIFSIPIAYEKNHKIIDGYIYEFDKAICEVVKKVNGLLPEGYRLKVKGD